MGLLTKINRGKQDLPETTRGNKNKPALLILLNINP